MRKFTGVPVAAANNDELDISLMYVEGESDITLGPSLFSWSRWRRKDIGIEPQVRMVPSRSAGVATFLLFETLDTMAAEVSVL